MIVLCVCVCVQERVFSLLVEKLFCIENQIEYEFTFFNSEKFSPVPFRFGYELSKWCDTLNDDPIVTTRASEPKHTKSELQEWMRHSDRNNEEKKNYYYYFGENQPKTHNRSICMFSILVSISFRFKFSIWPELQWTGNSSSSLTFSEIFWFELRVWWGSTVSSQDFPIVSVGVRVNGCFVVFNSFAIAWTAPFCLRLLFFLSLSLFFRSFLRLHVIKQFTKLFNKLFHWVLINVVEYLLTLKLLF